MPFFDKRFNSVCDFHYNKNYNCTRNRQELGNTVCDFQYNKDYDGLEVPTLADFDVKGFHYNKDYKISSTGRL